MRKIELETRISANIGAAKNFLAAASVTPIDRIDIHSALVGLGDAAAQKKDLMAVKADIARIDRELE